MSIPFLKNDSLAPGAVEQTAPGVRRVLCNNPGAFTFRGTNSWIIGQGNSVAILDPGPVDAAHLDALLAATKGERITHILVSHTHRDHSPGVAALKAATGAPSYGFGPHMTPPEQGGEGGQGARLTPQIAAPKTATGPAGTVDQAVEQGLPPPLEAAGEVMVGQVDGPGVEGAEGGGVEGLRQGQDGGL